MVRSIIVILILLFAAIPVGAETFKGEVSGVYYEKTLSASDAQMPGIDYRVNWKAWSLLGEPVVDANITWKFKPDVTTSIKNTQGSWITKPLRDLPSEAVQLIRIYDAKLRLIINMNDSTDYGVLEIDLGAPSESGWPASYNTPTSFSWDTLLKPSGINFSGDDYLPADSAKAFFKNGFHATGHEVVLKYNVESFRAWIGERYSQDAFSALDRAARKYIRAIEKIFNLNTFPLEQRHAVIAQEAGAAMNDLKPGALDAYKGFVAKLAEGIPPEFRIPSRVDAYQAELDAIDAEYKQDMSALTNRPAANTFATWEAAKRDEIAARGQLKGAVPEELIGEFIIPTLSYFIQYEYRDTLYDICSRYGGCSFKVYEDGDWYLDYSTMIGDYTYDGEYLSGSFNPNQAGKMEPNGCVTTGKFRFLGTDKEGELYELQVYTEYPRKFHDVNEHICDQGNGRTATLKARRKQQ